MRLFANAWDELAAGPPALLAPRSPRWAALRDAHLKREGWCRACGGADNLEVHHIRPVHLFPTLELSATNLITLCMAPGRECHLRLGHLGNWWKWNPGVRRAARAARRAPSKVAAAAAPVAWFRARRDGDDLVVENVRATCFGGCDDTQDNGETASGVNTCTDQKLGGCALPMRGEMFPRLSAAEHAALDGSPIPRVPWKTEVVVTQCGTRNQIIVPVIDLGPARYTGNAIDLTIAAARFFDLEANASNFALRVNYRVRGAAKLIQEEPS